MTDTAISGLIEEAEAALARRDLKGAREAFAFAERSGASSGRCSGGRWMIAMLEGDFDAAWRESDALRSSGAPDPHRFWSGNNFEQKRVIVRCLHGLGDAVQMLRYVPILNGIVASLVVEVPPRLRSLAPYFDGVSTVITWGVDAPTVPFAWDEQMEVMELPYVLRTVLSDLPLATKYLSVPEEEMQRVALCMGAVRRMRVGMVWAGGEWDPDRAIPFSFITSLLQEERFEFWNLQGGPSAGEAFGTPMRDASTVCGDGLLALTATIEHLDLVITIDTLAAHLAGALGKPVWVMLQHAGDWRWMTCREESPWYPTMRLFRQPRSGDWEHVIDAVRMALRAHNQSVIA